MRYFVFVSGASSGIGESGCYALVRHGYEVLAGVRNEVDAKRLSDEGHARIHPLLLDVTDQAAIIKARDQAEKIIGDGSLVAIFNNAGIVITGAVLYIPPEEWQHQFEVNFIGVIRTTQAFFPLLAKSKQAGDHHPRRIINMGSVSGLFASPFIGPYAASKYALEALSDSLRRELYMYDIQVVIIEAGNISTPIWNKAKQKESYFGPEYDSILAYKEHIIDGLINKGMPLKAVDDILIRSVRQQKVKARYLVRPQKWKFNLIRLLPARWIDKLIHKQLRNKSGIRPF